MPIAINGSGTVTGVSVGGLPDGIVDTDMIAAGAVTAPKKGAGSILQVVQEYRTSTFSETLAVGNFSSAVMTASITPASTNNKILVLCTVHIATGSSTNGSQALIKRAGTAIGLGDDTGDNRVRCTGAGMGSAAVNRIQSNVQMTVLDSPSSTSAVSYTAHIKPGFNGTQIVYLNRENSDSNTGGVGRSASSLTLIEIAV